MSKRYTVELGQCLRDARTDAGVTQLELAQRIGLSVSTVCMYEGGKRRPTVEYVSLVSETLGVPLDALVPKAELPSPDPGDEQTTIFDILGRE